MFIICGGEVEDFGGISHCQQSIKGGLLKIDCKSSAGGEGGGYHENIAELNGGPGKFYQPTWILQSPLPSL